MKALPPALIALSPGDLTGARGVGSFLERVGSALAAGLRGILLREPRLSDAMMLTAARELRARLDALDEESAGDQRGWLAVHDRVHVATAASCDAVHLGFRSLKASDVAKWVPASCAIGLSTHAFDASHAWESADYLFHGPVHSTPSKEGLIDPIGFSGIGAAVARTDRPIWALGGLRPKDVEPALKEGASGIAVLSGILGAASPNAETRRYLAAFSE